MALQNVLGKSVLRITDLDSESTRWDVLVAIPNKNTLVLLWWITGGITLFVAMFTTIVFISILRSKTAMRFSFNVYLLALMIPDIVHTSQSALVWFLSAGVGSFCSASLCRYQAWFVMFGLGGNSWVNAMIAWELLVCAKCSGTE